ncbi:MAG TPA: hypothetical protein VIU34_11845 [Steroidobacter sp.]
MAEPVKFAAWYRALSRSVIRHARTHSAVDGYGAASRSPISKFMAGK